MSLPPLTYREKRLYLDKATFYTPINAAVNAPSLSMIAGNDVASWSVAPFSETDSTPLSNVPVNLHSNPNFDARESAAGLTKVVNIFTSNELTS